MDANAALIFCRAELTDSNGDEIEIRLSSLPVRHYHDEPITIVPGTFFGKTQAENRSGVALSDQAVVEFILTAADIAAIMAEKAGRKPLWTRIVRRLSLIQRYRRRRRCNPSCRRCTSGSRACKTSTSAASDDDPAAPTAPATEQKAPAWIEEVHAQEKFLGEIQGLSDQ